MSMAVFDSTYPVVPCGFAQRLRKARMDAGLQIKELAIASGVNEMTIVNWEQGHTKPNGRKLEEVQQVLARLVAPWPPAGKR